MFYSTLRTAILIFCALFCLTSATAQNTAVVGDMDGDGQLSADDVTLLVNTLLGRTPQRSLRLAEGETPGPHAPEDVPHEYVDLGLPSGTLWATCNIGAATPEESGDFFAWGETLPKTTFAWSNYAHCDGTSTTLTHYCNNAIYGHVDGLSLLAPEHDAATARWGTLWCMPTQEQAAELLSDKNTEITYGALNGVDGYWVVSLRNDARIFLPETGFMRGADLNDGRNVHCWTKTLSTNAPSYARCIYIDLTSAYSENVTRMTGCPIRPVRVGGTK